MAPAHRSTRGGRIQGVRKSKSLTQLELARRCGVRQGTISSIEANRETPSRELLFRIATELGVSPQFIESGELAPNDAAVRVAGRFWMPLLYVVANHLLLPRRSRLAYSETQGEPLRAAVEKAWSVQTYCEFAAWALSKKATKIAAELGGGRLLTDFVFHLSDSVRPPSSAWIEYGDDQRTRRRLDARTGPLGEHGHFTGGGHSAIGDSPGECFCWDLLVTGHIYSSFRLGISPVKENYYESLRLDDNFARAALTDFIWSAANSWSDRRLAGWFSYLELPMDVFAPLARLARQYDSPDPFKASAERFLRDVTIDDADAFVGMFIDVYGDQPRYQKRFGHFAIGSGAAVYGVPGLIRGKEPVRERRLSRRKTMPRGYLDAVFLLGDSQREAEAERRLKELLPPHEVGGAGEIYLSPGENAAPCGVFRPPEILP